MDSNGRIVWVINDSSQSTSRFAITRKRISKTFFISLSFPASRNKSRPSKAWTYRNRSGRIAFLSECSVPKRRRRGLKKRAKLSRKKWRRGRKLKVQASLKHGKLINQCYQRWWRTKRAWEKVQEPKKQRGNQRTVPRVRVRCFKLMHNREIVIN